MWLVVATGYHAKRGRKVNTLTSSLDEIMIVIILSFIKSQKKNTCITTVVTQLCNLSNLAPEVLNLWPIQLQGGRQQDWNFMKLFTRRIIRFKFVTVEKLVGEETMRHNFCHGLARQHNHPHKQLLPTGNSFSVFSPLCVCVSITIRCWLTRTSPPQHSPFPHLPRLAPGHGSSGEPRNYEFTHQGSLRGNI